LVKLRLQRYGRKKRPYYHLVAADNRARRDGRIIEDLGRYNPVVQPTVAFMNTERVIYWLKNGAQPTDTVRDILKKEGIYYRLHLIGWGKTEEEINTTIDAWKAERAAGKGTEKTRSDVRKAALKAEEVSVKKSEAAAAEAKAKADAEAAKKAAEVVDTEEAPADEVPAVAEEVAADAPATEEAVAEEAAAVEVVEEKVEVMVDEGAPVEAGTTTEDVAAEEATSEVVDTEAAKADEVTPADEEKAN
jgi:small subunit ribosomal protein S16